MRCPKCQHENPGGSTFCGKCGTQIIPSFTETLEISQEELATGSVFAGRYQVIEELGKGGMGKVYRVLDKKLNEEVALKLIKPEIASDKKTLERFKNELKLARKVSQKNVGRMFDIGEETGTHYITMEYVPGEDLKSSIRRFGQLPIGKSISIAKQLCEGLSEAHSIGIVHRDLKPSNIMIDKNGNARIMDFGIARSLKGKGITGAGVIIGTPEYMSPEQVDGKDADQRSDIYSLGIILYEMLTGRLPFEGETPLSIAVQHRSDTPKDPKEFNAQIPDDLDRIILKCLGKKPEDRFQATTEILSELIKIEQGLPTTDRTALKPRPTTSRQITVSFSPKKIILPALGTFSVIIIGLLLWHPWSRSKAGPVPPSNMPSLAVMYFENNTGDESLAHWRKGISDLLITDLTQSRYLKVLGGDRLFAILSGLGQLEAKGYSSEVLEEVAAQGGVNHIARGSYSKAGEILRIDMVIQDTRSGEPIASKRVEGKGQEAIFSMVDELTKWTKENLQLTSEQVAEDLDEQIGTVTTTSPEAYRFYAEGLDHFNKQEYQESIDTMGKAVVLDPGFALAYRKMAVASSNINKWDEFHKYMQKALELSDRLTEKENLLIQATFFGSFDSATREAIEAYEKLINLYPESSEAFTAYHNLGRLYFSLEEWDEAIKNDKLAIEKDSNIRLTHANLALDYMARGDYQEAAKILSDAIDRFPDFALGHWELAQLHAFQGRFDLALDETNKSAAVDPTYTNAQFYHMMWDFERTEEEYKKWFNHVSPSTHLLARELLSLYYRTQGKFQEAENQIRLGMELPESQSSDLYLGEFYYQLAYLFLRSGNYGEALDALEKIKAGWEDYLGNKSYSLELKGWIYAEMGRMEAAQETAEELKRIVDSGPFKKRIRHHHFLMGMIQRKVKDYSEAIKSLKEAVSLLPHPTGFLSDDGLYRYFLALAYYESSNLQAAKEEFERLVGFIPGRNAYGDLYAASYYKLGQIYERLENRAKAVENYERFLDLWKDADPGLPEVEDTRKRLAGLEGILFIGKLTTRRG